MSNREMIMAERKCEGHELPPDFGQDLSDALKSFFSDYGYEITYYSEPLEWFKTMKVKDLNGDWLISFEHQGIDEDIQALRPASIAKTFIHLIIKDNGYEIYCPERDCLRAAFVFRHT
uniref:Uncharacterized protein n=1 Tax=Chenopodium quinoa TaxID=63459 RepID=A0A803LJE4_CHEQI